MYYSDTAFSQEGQRQNCSTLYRSCVSSRGVYYIPEKEAVSKNEKPKSVTELYEHSKKPWKQYPGVEIPAPARPETDVNAYDLSAPNWGYFPEVEFAAQDDCPYVLGEFVWTGFDYIGEPTPYGIRGRGAKTAQSSFSGLSIWPDYPKTGIIPIKQNGQTKKSFIYFPTGTGTTVMRFLYTVTPAMTGQSCL